MYGLLCENLRDMVISKHGEAIWKQVRELAGIRTQSFVLHNIYSDSTIACLVRAYSEVTSLGIDSIMHELGVRFVSFVEQNGYTQMLKVLGRNMRDFLNGLDSLHEYLRYSYTKLKPPSFFVEMESPQGMILHYRSKRVGFLHYVIGQIEEVGRKFYDLKVEIQVLNYKLDEHGCHVVLDLIFDNKGYFEQLQSQENSLSGLHLDMELFFDIFPFYVMFDRHLIICGVGNGFRNALADQDIVGKAAIDVFDIIRPTFEFTWENMIHTNVIFELLAKERPENSNGATEQNSQELTTDEGHTASKRLHLKGHMMYVQLIESLLFLASPVVDSLETMYDMGVYINDLPLHDASRDLVLQTVHQSAELKMALDSERTKSTQLEESVKCLEMERKKTDSLLYRMIPKQIADRLRKGESTLNTCETFENVSILFSDVVGFTKICTKISPMDVVMMLNSMYIKFDKLSVRYKAYKVETIGDGYMLAGGIPDRTPKHADNVADMALEMLRVIESIPNPDDSEGGHLKIRTGIHSGMVVAGVIGVKMPRYCLFGDTVNIAAKMESSGTPNTCHITETTVEALTEGKYFTKPRGSFGSKGVCIKTYWLYGSAEQCNADDNESLVLDRPVTKTQRDRSPVCVSACQRIISTSCSDTNPSDDNVINSMLTQATIQEMEQYIRENDLDLFSEGSITPEVFSMTTPFCDVNIVGQNGGPDAMCSATSSCLSLDSFRALHLSTADMQQRNNTETNNSNIDLMRSRVTTPMSRNASEEEQDDVIARNSNELEHLAEQSGTASNAPRRNVGRLRTNGSNKKCIIL